MTSVSVYVGEKMKYQTHKKRRETSTKEIVSTKRYHRLRT